MPFVINEQNKVLISNYDEKRYYSNVLLELLNSIQVKYMEFILKT